MDSSFYFSCLQEEKEAGWGQTKRSIYLTVYSDAIQAKKD